MTLSEIKAIADHADMIVNGYAFTSCELGFKVINLNNPESAAVLSNQGELIETNMDDIELGIARDYYLRNSKLLGVA